MQSGPVFIGPLGIMPLDIYCQQLNLYTLVWQNHKRPIQWLWRQNQPEADENEFPLPIIRTWTTSHTAQSSLVHQSSTMLYSWQGMSPSATQHLHVNQTEGSWDTTSNQRLNISHITSTTRSKDSILFFMSYYTCCITLPNSHDVIQCADTT